MKAPAILRSLLLMVLAVAVRAEEKPAGEEAKTGNWLVDAMNEKPAGSAAGSKTGTRPSDSESRATAGSTGVRADDGVVNPLSSYMDSWVTPGDLELLKANGTGSKNPDAKPVRPPSTIAAVGLAANPYVLEAPVPATAAPPSAPAVTPAAAAADKSDAAPAKSAGVPADLRKAQEDAKYFPQLKRF